MQPSDPKNAHSAALREDAEDAVAADRAAYLAQLTAPLDDMWASFAEAAKPYALELGGERVGSLCVDDQRRLLRLHLRAESLPHAEEFLRLAVRELRLREALVFTNDPAGLCAALDVATGVWPHTMVFERAAEPSVPELDDLVLPGLDAFERLVAFHEEAMGAPRAFLEPYDRTRIERGEVLLREEAGAIVCAGELRRYDAQPGIAHLVVVVAPSARGRGLASRMLTSLVARCRAEGLAAHASTEVENRAARVALERAGLRATHRLLRVALDRTPQRTTT